MKNNLDYFIRKYIENRPLFMALIRPQEAILFYKNTKIIEQHVLDFGCGDGFFAETVFGKKSIDVGLDLINSRAKEAEKNGIYKKIAYYDGKVIPYPNNYFNAIISNCVLEHILKLDVALKEIHRVLKPGGNFITTVMTDQWEKSLFGSKILGKVYVNWLRKKQEHFNLFSEKKWKSRFEKSGFTISKVEGYVSPKNALYLDLLHYFSLPSLISYKLFRKWSLNLLKPSKLLINFVERNISLNYNNNKSAALFIILTKK